LGIRGEPQHAWAGFQRELSRAGVLIGFCSPQQRDGFDGHQSNNGLILGYESYAPISIAKTEA